MQQVQRFSAGQHASNAVCSTHPQADRQAPFPAAPGGSDDEAVAEREHQTHCRMTSGPSLADAPRAACTTIRYALRATTYLPQQGGYVIQASWKSWSGAYLSQANGCRLSSSRLRGCSGNSLSACCARSSRGSLGHAGSSTSCLACAGCCSLGCAASDALPDGGAGARAVVALPAQAPEEAGSALHAPAAMGSLTCCCCWLTCTGLVALGAEPGSPCCVLS